MAKKELTMSEFRELIREEAIKLKKRIVLENEKRELQKELKSLMNECYMEDGMDQEQEIEEGLGSWLGQKTGLTDSPEVVQQRKAKFEGDVAALKNKGYTKFAVDKKQVEEPAFMEAMEKNGYSGRIIPVPSHQAITYTSGAYGASRLGAGGASQGLGV